MRQSLARAFDPSKKELGFTGKQRVHHVPNQPLSKEQKS
jgi:hypothetical protein